MSLRRKYLHNLGFCRARVFIAGLLLASLSLTSPGCFSGDHGSLYYGSVVVPRDQSFRWSDGGLPQVFDPALAAAPPDTDAVRALFEGLTEYDPRTLKPVPGVAERWESTEDNRVWTFYLRNNARWSTGEPVTAADFVRSWERTLRLGDLAPHTDLLNNIVGTRAYVLSVRSARAPTAPATANRESEPGNHRAEARLVGVQEIDPRVLQVKLQRPNSNFPALVAHPVFRPVKVNDQNENAKVSPVNLISNGAFHLAEHKNDSVQLQRDENYWAREDVSLQRVEFVKTDDAESALAAYVAGNVDAVTNAPFEPLALKLLAPYADCRRTTYAALTYYSFNTARVPFNDVRVREALAIAIDRERISADEMGGATEPANTFLPMVHEAGNSETIIAKVGTLNKDQVRARQLLADAGYPDGEGFPVIRLLINRNEQQRQVAQAVATSWRSTLKIETEIISKPWDEYEATIRTGEYDLARRGAVLQSSDETSNLSILFPAEEKSAGPAVANPQGTPSVVAENAALGPIETEAEALRRLVAIPIYFASSFSLVKPYVNGFDSNVLDAPSLKTVKIDTKWQPPKGS